MTTLCAPRGLADCPTEMRGTMVGFAWHRSRHTVTCSACWIARTCYVDQLLTEWAPDADRRASRNARRLIEDYLYLITTGETHGEAIAHRLRTSQAALERQLVRYGIHPLHAAREDRRRGRDRAKVAA